MAVRSRADLTTQLNTLLADNTSGNISLSDFRSVFQDIIDSCLNPTTDTGKTGLSEWNGTTQYYTNQIVSYQGTWYKANTNPALDGVFHAADWDLLDNQVLKKTVTILKDEVFQIHTDPYVIVQGITGKKINVIDAIMHVNFNLTPYSSSQTYLITNTCTLKQIHFDNVLESDGEVFVKGVHPGLSSYNPASPENHLADAQDLVFTSSTNPTAGDSDITITVYYTLI